MMTAEKARAALNSNLNSSLSVEMEALEALVAKAIRNNKNQVAVKSLSDLAKVKLKELGYKIEPYNNSDPRDGYSDRGFFIAF